MKYLLIIAFLVIVFLGGFLRLYKLDQIPPSLNWDEVAAGYNAYTIANWGQDEWGVKFPLVFKSFRDDKHPVHIYLTAVLVKLFGLSDFTTRLSSAIIGTLAIVVIFFLAKEFFESRLAGIFAALFLSISPYHLQFSRGLWEANFALFFFMLGLLLFYVSIRKKNWWLPLSLFSFGLSFFSYHSSKVVVPAILILIFVLYFKNLMKCGKYFYLSILVILIFIGLTVKEPRILGFARAQQNRFSQETISKTNIYQKTKSQLLGTGELILGRYVNYFSPKYLFVSGDQNPRNSIKIIGQFYKTAVIFIIIGLVMLFKIKFKKTIILLSWLILAPVPAALSSVSPSAARALFMMGSVDLVSAYGVSSTVSLLKFKYLKTIFILSFLGFLGFEFFKYISYYYTVYPKKDPMEWQYGMKQVVEYVSSRRDIYKVYMDKIRQQPYIFFLYYLKTPLPDLLKTVAYDQTESSSYNTVLSFGKYQFGAWDPIESYPNLGILYVVTPSYYDGLRYRQLFDVVKKIKYPNETDAFFLITGNEP